MTEERVLLWISAGLVLACIYNIVDLWFWYSWYGL
jgi:hypothetical protein